MKLKLVRLAEASSEMSGARKSVERLSLYTHSPLFWAPLSAQSAAAGMSLSDLAPGSNVKFNTYGCRIAERSMWRWVFWSTSIVDAFIQLSGLFFLRESKSFLPFVEKKMIRC